MKRLAEIIFPFAILAVLLFYTYGQFARLPYLGFYISYLDEITEVYVPGSPLEEGAMLRRVNGENYREMKERIYEPLFQDVEPGDSLLLTVFQNGAEEEILWMVPEDQSAELAARLNGLWWRPFVFWLAGTVIWFVLRPRNTTWRVLVFFQMIIALYLATLSGPVQGNLWYSVPFARFLGCMTLPIFLHLHWVFPEPFTDAPSWIRDILYLACFGGGLAAAADLFPFDISYWFAVFAVIGSILLLMVKSLFQRRARADNRFILIMFTFILLPGLVSTLTYSFLNIRLDFFTLIGAYLALPALPGAYFLVSLSRQPSISQERLRRTRRTYIMLVVISSVVITSIYVLFGARSIALFFQSLGFVQISIAILSSAVAVFPLLSAIELSDSEGSAGTSIESELKPRANRLVIPYLFLVLLGIIVIAGFVLLARPFSLSLREVQLSLLAGFAATALTLAVYPKFHRAFEYYFFGVSEDSTAIIEKNAREITTTLSLDDLSDLHVRQLLPDMLVRQAALLYLDMNGNQAWLYARGVTREELPELAELQRVLTVEKNGGQIFRGPEAAGPRSWIRILFPLRISGRLIGFWLLGDRDPDDEYPASILSVLQAISNQTAIALSNILLTSQLQELYQVSIDREEEARSEIARGLHDLVLNQLAALAMQITAENTSPQDLMKTYERVTGNLRDLIIRLRTSVLEFGLSHAVHEMASQLMDDHPDAYIDIQLAHYSPEYDSDVENHIFNIVQQVCENSLRHSGSGTITITGRFEEKLIELDISDDGVGFDPNKLNLSRLIEERRFGIVGIRERAALIRANLVLDSEPGNGTRVTLHWKAAEDA